MFVETTIDNYLKLIKREESEIEEKQLIIESLKESVVDKVKSLVLPYNDKMLHEAWVEQNGKKKTDRPMYEFIKKDLIDTFFPGKKVKLDQIVQSGWDARAYSFIFICNGVTFDLRIPNVKYANTENLSDMSHGRYSLYYKEGSCVWKCISSSYDKDVIAKAIDEFVTGKED